MRNVKAILGLSGNAVMSVGKGSGNEEAITAVENAVKNHVTDLSVAGTQGILFTVQGRDKAHPGRAELHRPRISKAVGPDATIFFGMSVKPEMQHKVRITIIATGMQDKASMS